MEEKCFVYNPIQGNKLAFHRAECDINLDSALNELDMLSTITNSRLDYLKEQGFIKGQVKKKRSSHSLSSVPLCVVQMNSDFVTKFSLSKNSTSITDCELSDESQKTDLRFKEKSKFKVRRYFRPYYNEEAPISCMRRRAQAKSDLSVPQESILASLSEEIASPPIVTRQDSGNKSNPSSPVKSQNSSTSVGCSIFRSRSLDDLEISKLNLKDDCCDLTSHGEIDTVSQRISKLYVS